MARFLVVVAAILALLLPARAAEACVNATMSDRDAIASLKDAEEALSIGDVQKAHRLAQGVLDAEKEDGLYTRATRIDALAYVRDPNATENDLMGAATELARLVKSRSTSDLGSDPALEADLGEALERAGKTEEALRTLAPLADRDLIGSAYAYAALSRAAKAKDSPALAKSARDRCLTIATMPAICDGAYPKPAVLWSMLEGKVSGYLVPAFALFGAFGLGRILVRRKKRELGSVFDAARAFGQRSFGAYAAAVAIVLFGVLALLAAKSMFLALVLAGAASIVAFRSLLGVGAFVKAVQHGDARTNAFTLRPATPEDAALPKVELFFHPGASTLERVEEPSYREGARTPLLRVVRRPAKGLVALGIFGVLAFFAAVFLFGVFFFMRGSAATSSAPIPLEAPPAQAR